MSFQFMPFYTGDYLRDTRHLTPEEHGIFVLLLAYCWDQKGPIPLDERKQCGIVNARSGGEIESLRRVLGEFFIRMDDGHYNKRMQREVERSEAISRDRSEAGKRGFLAKAKQLPSKSQASASTPTPTPITTPTPYPIPLDLTPTKPKNNSKSKDTPGEVKPPPATSETWAAYCKAYYARYGVDPVRNATVNGQLAMLVRRLGADEAPHVAAAYVAHQRSVYVAAKHPVGLLLRDCEGLRTEWASGRTVTDAQARQGDATQGRANVWTKLIEEARNAER